MLCRHDPVLAAAEVALHLEEQVLSKGTHIHVLRTLHV